MKRIAAFFDIDGTISREGLISQMFRKMIRYELIDASKWHEEVEPAFTEWDNRVGGYDHYLQKMVDIYSETVKNTEAFHIEYIARKVVEQRGERVYTYSRDRIRWHQDQGHLVIAISGSPMELVREMALKYQLDDFCGTVYEVGENGLYTGVIHPMWDSRSKLRALNELAEKHDIDLAASFAYGDTTGDFTMLNLVGYPFAINPTKELINKIRDSESLMEKIMVIVERKDVTYRMRMDTLDLVD